MVWRFFKRKIVLQKLKNIGICHLVKVSHVSLSACSTSSWCCFWTAVNNEQSIPELHNSAWVSQWQQGVTFIFCPSEPCSMFGTQQHSEVINPWMQPIPVSLKFCLLTPSEDGRRRWWGGRDPVLAYSKCYLLPFTAWSTSFFKHCKVKNLGRFGNLLFA